MPIDSASNEGRKYVLCVVTQTSVERKDSMGGERVETRGRGIGREEMTYRGGE